MALCGGMDFFLFLAMLLEVELRDFCGYHVSRRWTSYAAMQAGEVAGALRWMWIANMFPKGVLVWEI